MKELDWMNICKEIEQLCKLHDEAVANYEKCREFANRMSIFMSDMEDMGCNQMANRAMDILANCNPKVASHCEKANMEKGMLEQMKSDCKKRLKECDCSH
jgi:hypothetical protein